MSVRSWWLMLSVGLGILLNPLNSSMVSVALPDFQQQFSLNFTQVSWIIFSFYIASAVAQPVMGKASDLFGRRRIFLAGLVVAFAVSLLAPLTTSFGWLILFRIVQAIGTSMMVAVGMAIVRIHVTEKQATALSVLSIFISGAAAIGPFIGGMLMQWWDWRAIFSVNIPFVIASFLLAWRMIPSDEAPSTDRNSTTKLQIMQRMDAIGIVYFAVGLTVLLYGLLSAKSSGYVSLPHFAALLIGLLLILAFVRHEMRTKSPFIPLRTFAQHAAITWINVEYILVNLLFYSILFGLPTYLQTVRHVSEFHTGMLMLSLGLCSLVASPMAGRWIDRSGPRPALLVSALLMVLGSIWIVALDKDSPVISICMALAAFGISNGINNVGMQTALFQSTPREMIGVAAGLFNTSRYVGTILSSLLISVVIGGEFSYVGFRILALLLTVIALALLILCWRRRESRVVQESKVNKAM